MLMGDVFSFCPLVSPHCSVFLAECPGYRAGVPCDRLHIEGFSMMELVQQLVAGAGVSASQAEGGAGLLFGLVKFKGLSRS
jgi:hypothetical protein